jgi:hypothetical protein
MKDDEQLRIAGPVVTVAAPSGAAGWGSGIIAASRTRLWLA